MAAESFGERLPALRPAPQAELLPAFAQPECVQPAGPGSGWRPCLLGTARRAGDDPSPDRAARRRGAGWRSGPVDAPLAGNQASAVCRRRRDWPRGSDEDWYCGGELLTIVNAAGLVTDFVIGPATTDERWLAEALLRWRKDPTAPVPTVAQLAPILGPRHQAAGTRVGPTGPIRSCWGAGVGSDLPYLADLGFRGRAWVHHWREVEGTAVLTKADYVGAAATERRKGRLVLSSLRQVIETTNQSLTDVLGLKFPVRVRPGGADSRGRENRCLQRSTLYQPSLLAPGLRPISTVRVIMCVTSRVAGEPLPRALVRLEPGVLAPTAPV